MAHSIRPRCSTPAIAISKDHLNDSFEFDNPGSDELNTSLESHDQFLPIDGVLVTVGPYIKVKLNDSLDITSLDSVEDAEPSRVPFILGMVFALVANMLLVLNNYVIREFHLNAGELVFLRGFIQVPVSLMIAKCLGHDIIPIKRSLVLWLSLQGLGYSVMSFLCTFAVRLMPVQEFIVLCFTSPIPTVILSVLLLKERKGILVKCILIPILLLGVTLVVKPGFLFDSNPDVQAISYPQHSLGVILVVIASISGGVSNVCVAKAKSVSSFVLMTYVGAATVIFSLILLALSMPNRIVHNITAISGPEWLANLSSSLLSIIASLFIILANKMATPTVTSMFRSTEIPLVVAIELFWFHIYPDMLSIIGSSIVIVCVLLAPHAVTIGSWCKKPDMYKFRKGSILDDSV